MTTVPGPTEHDVVVVVAKSVEDALRNHGTNIAFQQVRTTPEDLVVHFSSFELNGQLQARWPGSFRVLLEKGQRHDLQVVSIESVEPPYVFEFKVPWSGDLIEGLVVSDLVKVSQHTRGYAVTVFLKLLKTPPWAGQRVDRYSVAQLKQAVLDRLRLERPEIEARVDHESSPIALESAEARIEGTVVVWRPEAKDDAT